MTSRDPRTAAPSRKGFPVYLVDDDDAVREALALLLETVGLEVTTFADPLDFLRRLDTFAPGTLVLDIRMPGLSGLRLQERLDGVGCTWPVVLISGHGDIEACRRAFRQGAVDFLTKPIDEQDLIDAVQKGELALRETAARDAERSERDALLGRLTVREREILELAARGLTSREIAAAVVTCRTSRSVVTGRAASGPPGENSPNKYRLVRLSQRPA